MIQGLLGKKVGMSQVFREDGNVVPVTVIEVGPCVVTQVKTQERDGYSAVQLGYGEVKRVNKPMAGHYRNSRQCRHLKEMKADTEDEFQVGQNLTVDLFQAGEIVDVIGRSKGRGFAGVMKRHGFGGGPRTHGQSDRPRAPGSIGGGTTPGKVFKGLKMAGHMGNRRVTVKGLEIVHVDLDRNLLLVKGGVPGGPNGLLEIRRTNKQPVTPAALVLAQEQAIMEPFDEELEVAAEELLEQDAPAQDEAAEQGPDTPDSDTLDSDTEEAE